MNSRMKYFALGLTTTALGFGILLAWDTLIPRLLGQPHLSYDLQPAWLRTLPRLLSHLPRSASTQPAGEHRPTPPRYSGPLVSG